jgi:hypothetical protein
MHSKIACDHNDHDHYADDVKDIHDPAPIRISGCSESQLLLNRCRDNDGVSRLAYGGLAHGDAESFPIFRTSWKSLDRRQLSDILFHRTPDTHCLRKGRSLYNARREQGVYRSFKTQVSCR